MLLDFKDSLKSMSNNTVKNIQKILNKLGYEPVLESDSSIKVNK